MDRLAHREFELVELVTPDGVPAGTATVAAAHASPGLWHRAFSVLLFGPDGRTLLQQRSATKTRFAGRWANSCCGHPVPGESAIGAAGRRLAEELGLTGVDLVEAGVYPYEARDESTGMVEREYDHVLVGRIGDRPMLSVDPGEVAAVDWVDTAVVAARPHDYVPWLLGVLKVAQDRPT